MWHLEMDLALPPKKKKSWEMGFYTKFATGQAARHPYLLSCVLEMLSANDDNVKDRRKLHILQTSLKTSCFKAASVLTARRWVKPLHFISRWPSGWTFRYFIKTKQGQRRTSTKTQQNNPTPGYFHVPSDRHWRLCLLGYLESRCPSLLGHY